ncbi:hypothetical protein Btru_006372 [Bulinus truncatus]|nr:hypothetical protein Btru_006372 [Bulinus truncatus]
MVWTCSRQTYFRPAPRKGNVSSLMAPQASKKLKGQIGGQSSCYNDPVSCVRTMRQVLVNSSQFWFGVTYNVTCQQESTSLSCDNPEPTRLSVASRIFGLSDALNRTELTSLTRQIKLAFVTFNSPAGSVHACGHTFKIPEVTNYMIDPLRTTPISSWSLQQIPLVAWDSPSNETLYTVVIWDAGRYYLHSMHINCYQSSLLSGTAIANYTSPANPLYAANPFVVLVIPQTGRLNHTQVLQAVEENKGRHQGRFYMSEFRGHFEKELAPKPSHMNIITLEAEPHSIQMYRDKFIVDNCPLLVSHLAPLRRMAELSNVTLKWGSSSQIPSTVDLNGTAHVTSLTLNMAVVYETGDFRVEYCCTNYSITSGMLTVDPFNDSPVRPAVVRLKPRVTVSPVNMKDRNSHRSHVYTMFMIDVAPAVDEGQANSRYFTHWLVTNIRNGDIDTGDELSEYFGPNPIIPDAPRTYMFLVYRQPVVRLNNSVIDQFCPDGRWICQMSLSPVLQAWNLTDLVGVTWFRAENDGFAKMVTRTYTLLKMRTMDEVCANVTGYPRSCARATSSYQSSTVSNSRATTTDPSLQTWPLTILLFALLLHLSHNNTPVNYFIYLQK